MGVESGPAPEALSQADTLKESCHVLLDYCWQLRNPRKAYIQVVETIQITSTYKSNEVYALKHLGKTAKLKLFSLPRRRKCYKNINIWKITQQMVPNIGDGTAILKMYNLQE